MAAGYEYMNETEVDSELKCTICIEPFQTPVSLSCQHTFCRKCIEPWLNQHQSCPTCRRSPRISQNEVFLPINTRIINNQLNQLLVRCIECNEINIQRGNFLDHEEKCLEKMMRCPSVDFGCLWEGPRDEQDAHVMKCACQQVHPIISRLRAELNKSYKIQNELYNKLEYQSSQVHFLMALTNQGDTINKECSKVSNKCQYSRYNLTKYRITFRCTLCYNTIRRDHVALHACSLNDYIDCICQRCYEKQYPVPEDNDDDEGADR